jgi:hypothetical protein
MINPCSESYTVGGSGDNRQSILIERNVNIYSEGIYMTVVLHGHHDNRMFNTISPKKIWKIYVFRLKIDVYFGRCEENWP